MKYWSFIAAFCVSAFVPWQSMADSKPAEGAMRRLDLAEPCAAAACGRLFAPLGPGGLRKTSGKAREIARRLDATGYYSRYSRALKGYPHLRSKKPSGRSSGPLALNAENRKRYRPHLEKIAQAHRLDPALMDAVIVVESAYEPRAVSAKGAIGLMQLMPDTAARFQVSDPFNPIANMNGGARYLRWLMDQFENDLKLVLAAYNAGEGAVARHGDAVPPYDETRTYVDRVLSFYKKSNR